MAYQVNDGRPVVTLIPINCSEIRVLGAMFPVTEQTRGCDAC